MIFRTKADLEAILGEPETTTLEFKSSQPLASGDQNSTRKYVAQTIVRAASAFLNSEGGTLIVGVEESKGVSSNLSQGIPRAVLSWEKLQSMIVDLIQPSVADLISVQAVRVDEHQEEPRFAFCVQVRSGNTAYQSADKLYYCRRAGQSVPMDDKDIRLRMLAGDRPRIAIELVCEPQFDATGKFASGARYRLEVKNTGLRTVGRGLIDCQLTTVGFSELNQRLFSNQNRKFATDFSDIESGHIGLMPGQLWAMNAFDFSVLALTQRASEIQVRADIRVFIDDGLPSEVLNYDAISNLPALVKKQWFPDTGKSEF